MISLPRVIGAAAFILMGCSLTVTRPVQEMQNTASAIHAAREVSADTRAPELYRQANEWFFKARQEYKLKNFKEARIYASKARRFAEEAEYEALNSGANRITAPPDPYANIVKKEEEAKQPKATPPMEGATPDKTPPEQRGIPVEVYQEQEAFRKKVELEKAAHPSTPPNPIIINNNQSGYPAPTPSP